MPAVQRLRSTNTTAQLHPEEKAFALELAKKSSGKFTAEQIEAQMRLFFVKGTDITPATDRVASGSGIYGPAGNWMHMGDGKTSVQMFEKADQQVIAYIKENTLPGGLQLCARRQGPSRRAA